MIPTAGDHSPSPSAIRRSKIIATLGPATDDPQRLRQLLKAGVDLVRLNFSHGLAEDHIRRATAVRQIAAEIGGCVAVICDLQGPKIRIARFRNGPIQLSPGTAFTLDAQLPKDAGNAAAVGIDYKNLPQDCNAGDTLLLDDGRIVLEVVATDAQRIHCQVLSGGGLSDYKGINRMGGGLSAPALTAKDKNDIQLAREIETDYLAVSFPRRSEDIHEARELLRQAGGDAWIIAKIERAEAIRDRRTLDDIIRAADAVMVARGDLGVEIGNAELVGMQKYLIRRANELRRMAITATQMMESMIHSPQPTRAEVSDVANAVLDGSDAVMLSAETAVGEYPVHTVDHMVRIILGAENSRLELPLSFAHGDSKFTRIDETIAVSAIYAANHLRDPAAIICLTESGFTPLLMSRLSSAIPIFALCHLEQTRRRLQLCRGVTPVLFDAGEYPPEKTNHFAIASLKDRGLIADGDLVIITKGDYINVQGGTNAIKLLRVGETVF